MSDENYTEIKPRRTNKIRNLLIMLTLLALAATCYRVFSFTRPEKPLAPEQATAMATLQFRLTQLVMETQPVYVTVDAQLAAKATATPVPNITTVAVTATLASTMADPTENSVPATTMMAPTLQPTQQAAATQVGGVPVIAITSVSKELPSTTSGQVCFSADLLAEKISPDPAAIPAGSNFVKTWRVRNSGNCTWESGTQLVYLSGERMSKMEAYTLATQVLPGGVMDISAEFTAPMARGTFTGYWQLLSMEGQVFGAGEKGQKPLEISIAVH